MMKLFSTVFMLMNILIALLFSSVFLNHNWMVYAGGDGDGERYTGPINQGDSSEKIIYCTFNEEVKAPICEGTSRSDIMLGTIQEDYIDAKGSDDAIQGRAGNDDIFGGNGDDDIQGGEGSDSIYGEDGSDLIYGGLGGDYLVGGKGNDEFYGGLGEDILEGGPGSNYFDCGDDYDIIIDFDPSKDVASNNCEDIRTDL